jgi:sec-independent protein translocase protein TatA
MTSGLLAPSHIIMLTLVALLLFGPKRLPEIGRSLGHSMREFKDSVSGENDQHTPQSALSPADSGKSGLEHPAVENESRTAVDAEASMTLL